MIHQKTIVLATIDNYFRGNKLSSNKKYTRRLVLLIPTGPQIQLFRNASKKSLSVSPLCDVHSNGGLEQA